MNRGTQQERNQREDSDAEDDIPLFELRKRARISGGQENPQTLERRTTADSSLSDESDDDNMHVDAIQVNTAPGELSCVTEATILDTPTNNAEAEKATDLRIRSEVNSETSPHNDNKDIVVELCIPPHIKRKSIVVDLVSNVRTILDSIARDYY